VLSIGIDVLLFVIEKFAISVVSRWFTSNDGWATVSVVTVYRTNKIKIKIKKMNAQQALQLLSHSGNLVVFKVIKFT
jgi:hypothetical protein